MIATVIAAGVVQPAGSGLGGGGFAIWSTATNDIGCLDFLEKEFPKNPIPTYMSTKKTVFQTRAKMEGLLLLHQMKHRDS